MIRLENNRIDKLLLKKYLKELSCVVKNVRGLNDINKYRERFEVDFANFIKADHVLSVGSGTDALQLALLALRVGEGDEVIIPDLTYISTALAVKYTGAKVVCVDVKPEDLTIDCAQIERKITKHTKAIIAVHMFGRPCDFSKLKQLAKKYGLFIIEDACQALGSKYHGEFVGTLGDIGCFSFSYYKPLSSLAGNGGMMVFKKEAHRDTAVRYLEIWNAGKYFEDTKCKFVKMSLTDLATVRVKLSLIKHIFISRLEIKEIYEDGLARLKNIVIFKDRPGTNSIMENYLILINKRNLLRSYLKSQKIDSDISYVPIHLTELFKRGQNTGKSFQATKNYYLKGLHLPLFSFMTKDEAKDVVDAVRNFHHQYLR